MPKRQRKYIITCGPYRLKLSSRPHLMGIINLTPDSFSDGGLFATPEAAYRQAAALVEAGADILDLGAESTRPGAPSVAAAEERRRLLPALKRIRRLPVAISVDTSKPEVAKAALDEGAHLINDITGMINPALQSLAAERRVPVVIMHLKGTPRTMQRSPRYANVVAEVKDDLLKRARAAAAAGVPPAGIILDPGIGFGKTLRHNLQLLHHLDMLVAAGYPVLVGPSRKSFIAGVLGSQPPRERAWGTAAAVAAAVLAGVHILRVHDVAAMRQVATVAWAIARERFALAGAGA
jgi:dihydropteroate synthase